MVEGLVDGQLEGLDDFVLVVPVGADVGLGEGLVEGLVRGGMLLQRPLASDLVEAWWRAWRMAIWRGGMHGLQRHWMLWKC